MDFVLQVVATMNVALAVFQVPVHRMPFQELATTATTADVVSLPALPSLSGNVLAVMRSVDTKVVWEVPVLLRSGAPRAPKR